MFRNKVEGFFFLLGVAKALGVARLGSARLGSNPRKALGVARLGSARLGSARQGSAPYLNMISIGFLFFE